MRAHKDPDHWRHRANESIAHGALTNSKRPETFINGLYPTHLVRGSGCEVWDHQGRRFIDFIGANGTNLVGYGNSQIQSAVTAAFARGALLSLGSDTEVLAAEKMQSLFPVCERVRFLKTGSEACAAAIRIARAATGRSLVAVEGYHGWHDGFTSLTPPAHGVTESFDYQPYTGDLTKEHAAVIVEPVMLDESKERKAWLNRLRKQCDATGAVLIFDEIITGLRFPRFSVSAYYGVRPDLALFGKAIGGGLPLAAVGGKKHLMESDYFVSSTFAGDTVSLSAFMTIADMLHKSEYLLKDLWEAGSQHLAKFNSLDPDIQLAGYPTRAAFKGDPILIAKFWQAACNARLLYGPSWFFTFAHLNHPNLLEVIEECVWNAKKVKLQGQLPQAPQAARSRSS